jgi:thioesterase domain-containing protein
VNPGKRSIPLEPLQVMLLDVWKDVLEVETIGIDQSFVSVGGTPERLEQMVRRASEVCGQAIPHDLRTMTVTVEELAAGLLRPARDAAQGRPPYIARNVNARATRMPLFFLHGDYGGGGLYCLQLAVHLGRDQPLYAIAPHGLDGEPLPSSIEAMATERIATVRGLQPAGPYLLGGYCNGAIVAFEMARQLCANGERVERLILVTPVVFPPLASLESLGRLRSVSLRELPGRVRDGLAWRLRSLSSRRPGREISLPPRSRHPAVAAVDAARDRLTVEYSQRMRTYWPRPYPGTVTLLQTRPPSGESAPGPSGPWSHLAARVDVHVIPGEHLSCITTHVRELGRCIRACLDGPTS